MTHGEYRATERWGHASGQPDRRIRLARVSLDRGANGSIHGGSLFKPHGRLKLTLLAICIDIATL
jgi:hypothetical protein